MPSNGKKIVDFLCDMFPRHGLDERQIQVWSRGLAKDNWETKSALEAVKAMLKGRPTDFLPAYPAVEASIAAHHHRLAEAKSPKKWKEEPTKEEAARVNEQVQGATVGIFGQLNDAIKRPGWGAPDTLRLMSWRRQNNVPPPVGPVQRAARDRLPPGLLAQERALYREINAKVRARR